MAILGYKDGNRVNFIRAFGLDEWLKTRGLAGWLEIATDELEASAKQRIAREIGSHYAEAVSAHMAAGEPESSAQVAALVELGDPRVATANFRKSHLTESEAKWMQAMERVAAQPLFSFRTVSVMLMDISPLAAITLLCSPTLRLLAIAVLVMFACFRFVPRLLCIKILPRISFLRRLALSNLFGGAALAAIYAQFHYSHNHGIAESGIMFLYFFSIMGVFRSNSPYRIWNKLRKMSNERNDLPPRQTIAS